MLLILNSRDEDSDSDENIVLMMVKMIKIGQSFECFFSVLRGERGKYFF